VPSSSSAERVTVYNGIEVPWMIIAMGFLAPAKIATVL
jgi:hypothetical protein